jgi:hypothetical protein
MAVSPPASQKKTTLFIIFRAFQPRKSQKFWTNTLQFVSIINSPIIDSFGGSKMRATNNSNLSVLSILFLTIACTTVPAWADVIITAAQVGDTNEVIISFDATTETNLVRAFAFDIRLDDDANIIEVTGINPDYYIYPGTIQIDASGNVVDYGTALAEYGDLPSGTQPGLDSNGVTIEMASLYAPVGPGSPNAPAKSGDLLLFSISDFTCITITPNLARAGATGVVMEDPNEVVDVILPEPVCVEFRCCEECMKSSSPFYSDWAAWGKPDCWCYSRQCRGDATGTPLGPYWVQLADLNVLKSGWYKVDTVLATIPNGICADFNHSALGPYRVQLADLNILKTYWYNTVVPECDKTHYNFWETP